MHFTPFASIILALMLSSVSAFGCSCVVPPPGIKSARELAEWRTQGTTAIFEGQVESAELKSQLLEASVGDIVPANLEQTAPVMLVTFKVSRSYRGVRPEHVQVETGLGGGDCGFGFGIGGQYLVYAYKGESGRLSTGICTATDLLEESQTNLAYLRGDPFAPEIAASRSHAKTGKLCVRVVQNVSVDSGDGRILLLRIGSKSPIASDEAEADGKGLYCAANVDPGKYHLLFAEALGESPTSFVYYPGVTKVSLATPIDIRAGQAIVDLVFKIPPQPTFSVKGIVSASNNSPLPSETKVILVSADQPFLALAYAEDTAPNGSFAFPKVLPGKYWSFVDVNSDPDGSIKPGWLTRKTELLVDRNLADLSLVLIPD